MKKILSVLSLVLALLICIAMPTVAAEETKSWEYVPPNGIQVYYANDISGQTPPVIDGVITEGEYGNLTVNIKDHLTMVDGKIDSSRADEPCADSFDYYFAYDDNFIYIAYVDYGGVWEEGSVIDEYIKKTTTESVTNYVSRNNYFLGLGFLLDDVTSFINLGCSSRGFDESRLFDLGRAQPYDKDIYTLVSDIYMKKTLKNEPEKVITEGDGKTVKNPNSLEGPYVATVEIKLEKAQIIDILSNRFFLDFEELPNAMYVEFMGRSYVLKEDGEECKELTSYNKYFCTDITSYEGDLDAYGISVGSTRQYLPGLVVFGDENTKLHLGLEEGYVLETEASVTEPVTEAFATESEATEAPVTTEAPETEAPKAEGGCGGAVSLAGIALVAALGTCTAFVAKKKED